VTTLPRLLRRQVPLGLDGNVVPATQNLWASRTRRFSAALPRQFHERIDEQREDRFGDLGRHFIRARQREELDALDQAHEAHRRRRETHRVDVANKSNRSERGWVGYTSRFIHLRNIGSSKEYRPCDPAGFVRTCKSTSEREASLMDPGDTLSLLSAFE
jgi:hypothetical protein